MEVVEASSSEWTFLANEQVQLNDAAHRLLDVVQNPSNVNYELIDPEFEAWRISEGLEPRSQTHTYHPTMPMRRSNHPITVLCRVLEPRETLDTLLLGLGLIPNN